MLILLNTHTYNVPLRGRSHVSSPDLSSKKEDSVIYQIEERRDHRPHSVLYPATINAPYTLLVKRHRAPRAGEGQHDDFNSMHVQHLYHNTQAYKTLPTIISFMFIIRRHAGAKRLQSHCHDVAAPIPLAHCQAIFCPLTREHRQQRGPRRGPNPHHRHPRLVCDRRRK
jgi:hypothetical protein